MDFKNNKNHYSYTYFSMNHNINILSKIKKNKIKNFIFNYLNYCFTIKDIKYIINNLDKIKKYKDLTNENHNYEKGILSTFIKMCHFTYYRKYLPASFFKMKEVIFYNNELLVIKYYNHLFINIRGTITSKAHEIFQNLSIFKKQFYFENKNIHTNFLVWKKKLLKKYSIMNVLKKYEISDRYLFHRGFMELYYAYKIKNKIMKILNKYKINTIYLNGYSLGGALCTFLAIDIYEYYYKLNQLNNIKVNLITFSSPGIMNSNLSLFFYYLIKKKFINKYIRIVNESDIITSSFTDPSFYLSKFTGLLRHFDASIPMNKKNIIVNENDKINKKTIIIKKKKYLKNFFKKQLKEIEKKDLHSLYSFTNNKEGILYSI